MPIAFGDTPITSVSRGANAIASATLERLGFPGQTATVFSAISPPDAPTNVAITVEEDFAPSDITGLQAWYDASDASTLYDATTGGSLVAADGGVARWEDKSGNGNHATQGTAGERPLRKASVQNSLDVLRLDGSDDVLSVPSSTATFKFLHSDQHTVFFCGKLGSVANPDAIMALIDTRSTNNVGFTIFYEDRVGNSRNDNIIHQCRALPNEAVGNTSANDFAAANVVGLVTVVGDPTNVTASERSALRWNGGEAETNNTNTDAVSTANSDSDLHIGGRESGTAMLDGDICEIIIYNSALSDTDREAVENYLLAKWGIS